MYAFWKSQGCYVNPWNADISVGATRIDKNKLQIVVNSTWNWNGKLLFDIPRHKEYFRFPMDYPRLNQFPEWFTIEKDKKYLVKIEGKDAFEISGEDLQKGIPLTLSHNSSVIISISLL